MRICPDGNDVITGSADRSIRVWNIARNTYKQTTTLRHSSTTTCLDISTDCNTTVSGHMDGSLRFWDLRSGDRTAEITGLHSGGVTSVQFNPVNKTYLLSNGKDSSLKITDVRMCSAVNTLQHRDFRTLLNWSGSCYSPDGEDGTFLFIFFFCCVLLHDIHDSFPLTNDFTTMNPNFI